MSDNLPTVQITGGKKEERKEKRRNIRKKVAMVKLINQGAYGCIYKPGFRCNGQPDTSDKIVSKIQKKSSTSDNELLIGKKVAAIPNYSLHFAPVIETCPINIANIRKNLVESCDVVKKAQSSTNAKSGFMLNKIRYAGKDTLETYMRSQMTKRARFLSKFFEIYSYLLHSIDLLADHKVVHYDLKENNVMYNVAEHAPIIIDFGLSVDMTTLLTNQPDLADYQNAFYVYYENYPPWCLEIILCSYLVQQYNAKNANKKEYKSTTKVDTDKLLRVIDGYFNGNDGMKLIAQIDPGKVHTAKANWRQYIKELCVRKTEMQVVNALTQSWTSWDNFGMSAIFLSMWNRYQMPQFKAATNTTTNATTNANDYQDMLINILLSIPPSRPTTSQTIQHLPGILGTSM